MKRLALALFAICLAACGSQPVADKMVSLATGVTSSVGYVASGVVGIGMIVLVDPFSPNWEIEEVRLSEDTYRLAMRMKRYHTGGAGESMQILKRRASQLQREHGYGAYELLEYTEGIESNTLGAQRVAEGTIRLNQPPASRREPEKTS